MAQSPLKITLSGNFRVIDQEGTGLVLTNRRGRAILALLSLTPGEPVDRKLLCHVLWNGRFAAQARASLRQCLHDLTRQLPGSAGEVLQASHSRVLINPAAISSDLQRLEGALAAGDGEVAIARLGEMAGLRLLDDITVDDVFDDWLATKRLLVAARLQAKVENLADKLSGDGRTEMAAKLLTTWRRRSGKPSWRDRIRIAVLPFEQQGQVAENSFLAEGIGEELRAHLGQVWKLSVVGRASVAAVSGQGLTVPELAARMNVSHLIDGLVRWTPEGIVVTIQLIDGHTGHELWSDRRVGSPESFLSSRQMFSTDIVASLCRAMGVETRSPTPRRMTANREAYALYLQGRAMTQRPVIDGSLAKAIELLERALLIDPDFAECWTALAEAYIHTTVYTPCLDRVEQSEKAASYARRALELEPGQGYAHAILGIHEWTCFNPLGALEYAMKAYELEPNNADVTMRLGLCLLYLGRTRDALPYVEAAIEQDPVYARNYGVLCVAHLNRGDIDSAIAAGKRMVDLGLPGLHLATAQRAAGLHDEAVETYYRSRLLLGSVIMPPPGLPPMSEEARDHYWQTAARGVCSGNEDARAAYCGMLDMLHATMPDPYDPSIAWPAVWMGHSELVMNLYRKCIHPANMAGLMSLWADVEPIRQIWRHPDFMDFAEDIGMVAAWERYSWPDVLRVHSGTV
ncbi:MAG: hypothetical protein V2I43_05550 [Parvularcula sp.]|nr:hypothetical protein [Parvularcula sp.]